MVGAGHNGLVAAILLARAGWKVTVFERNATPGGAIQTAEITLPGFRHDLYAANLNLFMGSAFFAEHGDDLRAHGFEPVVATNAFASVFPDGTFVGVSSDAEQTLASLRAVSPADAERWSQLHAWFHRVAPAIFGVLGAPMPSLAAGRALWAQRAVVRREWPRLVRLTLQSPRELVEEHFEHPHVQALCATWGMHLDFPPDVSGGAVFPFLETFATADHGMALGRGGARSLVDALVGLLGSLGGELVLDAEVERVLVERGRAVGVALADGSRHSATRAVVANLTPRPLFGNLVPTDAVDADFRRAVLRYRHGPGTMMVHLALSDLPAWSAGERLREFSYVHIAPRLEEMTLAYSHAVAGLLPARPTLVVGQPTAVDATRAPDGQHVLWVQVRMVPARIVGDAAEQISATAWDDASEPYAERVLDLIETYAPGLRKRILARHVVSPLDLERANPNLVGGDQLGGSHHLAQHFLLRPLPGFSRYRTPIERLYMCGAGTWPGAGVGAGSGYLLGRALAGGDRISLRAPIGRGSRATSR